MFGKENAVGIMAGQAARIAIQAGYFMLLARLLGVSGYGAFAAIVAVGAIAIPFSSLGTNILMVRNVAHHARVARAEWSRAILYSCVLGTLLAAVTAVFVSTIQIFDAPMISVFWIIAADAVGFKIMESSGGLWQALGKSRQLIWLPPIFNLFRVGIAAMFLFTHTEVDITLWATIYALVTIPLAAIVAIYTTLNVPGKIDVHTFWKITKKDLSDGLLFCVGLSSATAYNDIDKTQLASIDSTATAGIYASAYKIIDMAYVPIRAIAIAYYPRFFEAGKEGIIQTNSLAKKLLLPCCGFGVLGFFAVQISAPLVPRMLGQGFEGSEALIRGLAVLLLLRPFSFAAGDSLTGAGYQGFRSVVQVAMAGLNFSSNLVLIPIVGVWGAILSTIGCEIILATTLWGRALKLQKMSLIKKTDIGEKIVIS